MELPQRENPNITKSQSCNDHNLMNLLTNVIKKIMSESRNYEPKEASNSKNNQSINLNLDKDEFTFKK